MIASKDYLLTLHSMVTPNKLRTEQSPQLKIRRDEGPGRHSVRVKRRKLELTCIGNRFNGGKRHKCLEKGRRMPVVNGVDTSTDRATKRQDEKEPDAAEDQITENSIG